METSLLLGQTVAVWLIALWLVLGALENIRHPSVNRELVAGVMAMRRMQSDYPEIHAVFRRNAVSRPALHRAVFRAIVAVEVAVALLLLAGAAALSLAPFGAVAPEEARALASLGATGFTAIWGAFLVGGQWFHYWCGYEGSQATHFFATIWGLVTFAILHLGA